MRLRAVLVCACISLYILVYPCISLYILVYPCLSLYILFPLILRIVHVTVFYHEIKIVLRNIEAENGYHL